MNAAITLPSIMNLYPQVPQATHSSGPATRILGAVTTPQPPPGVFIALGVLSAQPMHAVREAITTLFRICDKIVQVSIYHSSAPGHGFAIYSCR